MNRFIIFFIAIASVCVASTTIPVTDTNWFFSPYNWLKSGSTYAQTNTPGAYFKTKFAGTSCTVDVDVSPLTAASVSPADYPAISYSVDGGAYTRVQLTSATTTVSVATGLADENHTITLIFVGADWDTYDRWNVPTMVLRVTGLTLDTGKALSAPTLYAGRAIVYGDSNGEGYEALAGGVSVANQDASKAWPLLSGWSMLCEVGVVSFAGQGYTVAVSGANVPALTSSWDLYSSGQSRLSAGLLSPAPDYILCGMGQNDSGASDGAVSTAVASLISSWRTAAPSAKIAIVLPANLTKESAIRTGVTNAADGNTVVVDIGYDFFTENANYHNNSHLSVIGHRIYAAFISSVVYPVLIPAQRLRSSIAGTDIGVPGGIAQYMPGGASQRTTLRNVVDTYGADNTGATDCSSAVNSAIAATGSGEVVYFPPGVYKFTTNPSWGYKDNYTIRGAGQFALSRSVNSYGTGTKTFEVEAGLGYTAGCGVWVWLWDRDFIHISSITRSGTTATVTTTPPHGFATGQIIDIRGVTETAYNGGYLITVTGANTFTYTVSGSPSTPATGSFKYATLYNKMEIASITHVGTTATVTTTLPHLLNSTPGQPTIVAIVGANQPEYNVVTTGFDGSRPIVVTGANTFTYTTNGTPASDGTGSMFVGMQFNLGPQNRMIGTCVSYSGTTLVVDVDSVEDGPTGPQIGVGDYAMWKVSVTLLDQHATGSVIGLGGSSNSYMTDSNGWELLATVSGSPSAWATSITLSDASLFAQDQLMQIGIMNNYDPNAGAVGDNAMVVDSAGYEYRLRQMVRITGKVGNVVSFTPALLFDLPVGLTPRAISTSDVARLVGVENLAISAFNSSSSSSVLAFNQTDSCWAYRVSVFGATNYQHGYGVTLYSETRECWAGVRGTAGSNGAGMIPTSSSSFLVVDSAFQHGGPCMEINGNTHYAVVNCLSWGGDINTNHGSHGKFGVLEGNVAQSVISDGYFGSESEQTELRNTVFGYNYYYVGNWNIKLCRFAYNFNTVGNVVGYPGFMDGAIFYGYPNIGNELSSGTAQATSGDYWLHLDNNGTRGDADLTTRLGNTSGVFTFDNWTTTEFTSPATYNADVLTISWSPYYQPTNIQTGSDYISGTGNVITLSNGGGSNLPTEGNTTIKVWANHGGYQERDLDVEGTAVQKGNWFVVGNSGSQTSLDGGTLPDSYVYTSKPAQFGSLTWPAVNPASPDFSQGLAVIPIAYMYFNGEMPATSGGGSTANVTNLNVGTIRLAP